MQNSNARTVRGLSIAVVVIAGLGVLASIIGLLAMAAGHAAIGDPDIIAEITYILNADPELYYELGGYYIDEASVAALASLTIVICVAVLAWGLICSVIVLVAGIMGMRNVNQPEKLGATFGWAIAGAIAAFLSGSWIAMVLLIISAVCISRLRKPAVPYQPYAQPCDPYAAPYGQQGQNSACYVQPQGMPAAQTQPYGQPVNPYAQPSAYAQPADTAYTPLENAQPASGSMDNPTVDAQPASQSEQQN